MPPVFQHIHDSGDIAGEKIEVIVVHTKVVTGDYGGIVGLGRMRRWQLISSRSRPNCHVEYLLAK